ncbi:allantoicase, partial [Streptomyces sp. TRM76130]|nr:allantoicase [Streptomyces sp. TRM76130]
SRVRAIEIDTAYLKGNSAGWAALSVRDGEDARWREVLPRTRLQPDTNHRFVLPEEVVGTHARVDVFPDGGISRLRLFGALTEDGAARLTARHQELGG